MIHYCSMALRCILFTPLLISLCNWPWIISINLYSSSLILSYVVSSLLISLGKEFFISSIYIFNFRNFYLILFIISIILLKFSICECMAFTFSTKAYYTLIIVILKSLIIPTPGSFWGLNLILLTAFPLDNGSFFFFSFWYVILSLK